MRNDSIKHNILTLNVGYAVHHADWNWQNIRSPFSRIYLVTKGEAIVEIEDQILLLRPGYIYMIPAFATHTDRCYGDFEHYYLHLFEDSGSGESLFEEWDFPHEVPADELCHKLFHRICEINPTLCLAHSNPESYDNKPTLEEHIRRNMMREIPVKMESRGIVMQLISRFIRSAKYKASVEDKRIRETLLYIKNHLDEAVNIDILASIAFLSKDHYIRLFKRMTGKTPVQYMTKLRIEKAEVLLTTSSRSIKDIAACVGFEDHSYFIRIFRKILGITPRQYRELYKF